MIFWGDMMKTARILIGLFVFVVTPSVAHAACAGQTVTRTGPNGKTLTLCLDGKHSTCMRDSQRLGNTHAAAKRFCDSKNLR